MVKIKRILILKFFLDSKNVNLSVDENIDFLFVKAII